MFWLQVIISLNIPGNIFFSLLQNVGLKHGKALVQYIVSYFHDIMFQMDHERAMFCQFKGKKGAQGLLTWPRGLPP